MKKLIVILTAGAIIGICSMVGVYYYVQSTLPHLIKITDYEPLLVSQVYDRNNVKIGEYFRERRVLTPYEKIPKQLVQAFMAAEDDKFFEHKGVNFLAMLRATIANLKAGRKVQGGSTITQQVAKTLMLSSEKTFVRKLRDIMLAMRMEDNLSKEEIMYLYLNQIYFGQGAYGVEEASQIYFRKPVQKLELQEMAILAGLPQAPSRYSPLINPQRAKERQVYVLNRMAEVGFIKKEEAARAAKLPVTAYVSRDFESDAAFYLDTVRQLVVKKLGEDMVLDKGLRIYTGLDIKKQIEAQNSIDAGLRSLDKRQGFRGAKTTLTEPKEIEDFLLKERDKLIGLSSPVRVINVNGTIDTAGPLDLQRKFTKANKPTPLPPYVNLDQIVDGIVTKVDDHLGLVYVRFGETQGLIDLETMQWARKPNPDVRFDQDIVKKPSQALKVGNVIEVKVTNEKFASQRLNKMFADQKSKLKQNFKMPPDLPNYEQYLTLELEQEPLAESSLVSFDQQNQDVLALVGGHDFKKSEFNRALQAARQTGSSFKTIVYASALDKSYTPATPIMDAPIVFDESDPNAGDSEGQEEKSWKPTNHSKSFGGDILFRNALIKSLNVPTVKIIEDIGIPWPTEYARRLGIFSPLNPDFTMALGSSSVTLYEMTKVFAQFGRLGKRIRPLLVHRVEDHTGKVIAENLSLDLRFEQELGDLDKKFEEQRTAYLDEQKAQAEQAANPADPAPVAAATPNKKQINPPIYFEDPDQLVKPTTAYVMTSLLKGVVEEKGGTGGGARALGREVAGKTGTTNGYYDAWFIGYTPQISTGVWVGFDQERTLGKGEVGGRAALPIWLQYMKFAHEGLPEMTFPVPPGIVFATIDNETGKLASAQTKSIVRQAFVEGTEPTTSSSSSKSEEETDFYKQDLSE